MKRISKNRSQQQQQQQNDDRLAELLTDINIAKKTTSEESIKQFQEAIEAAIWEQVAQFGFRIVQKMGVKTVEDQVSVYNSAVARFMRDHCRALASHYHEVLYKSIDPNDNDDLEN